jgi:hypothetical protein
MKRIILISILVSFLPSIKAALSTWRQDAEIDGVAHQIVFLKDAPKDSPSVKSSLIVLAPLKLIEKYKLKTIGPVSQIAYSAGHSPKQQTSDIFTVIAGEQTLLVSGNQLVYVSESSSGKLMLSCLALDSADINADIAIARFRSSQKAIAEASDRPLSSDLKP